MSTINNTIKSYYKAKYPTKKLVKKYKRKMGQWINDNQSAYIREDLVYNLIPYINLGVIKADECRKNLGITNNQSIRREEDIIAIIMKIFAKEIMVRQHEVPRLPYEIDLCLIVHKLVTEVDEDGHVYYGEEKHQIRQKLIENLGFIFIRINPNVEKFDLNVEMANIYNYINESPVRQVINLTENIKKKVCKRIIELNVKRF